MIPLPSAATCSGPCSCDYVVLYMFYDIFYSQSCITLAVRLVESGAVKCCVHAEHIAAAGAYRAHGNDGPRSARFRSHAPLRLLLFYNINGCHARIRSGI